MVKTGQKLVLKSGHNNIIGIGKDWKKNWSKFVQKWSKNDQKLVKNWTKIGHKLPNMAKPIDEKIGYKIG